MPAPPSSIVDRGDRAQAAPSTLPSSPDAVAAAPADAGPPTTHSPQFLDSFGETRPTTTVMECREGQTVLERLGEDRLDYWLEAYSLGKLFTSGILEAEL